MDTSFIKWMAQHDEDVLAFTQDLVRTKSYSDQEKKVAELIAAHMQKLGYDEAGIDATGNVVGRIGSGKQVVLFDSHMDTVEVHDQDAWAYPPFGGELADGKLYGRGATDMKAALAASVYAGAAVKALGYTEGRTIYVTCTVCEEFCDGESLRMLMDEKNIRPDYVIICEPSSNVITLGHKGKAQIVIKTHGVSAHGSAPEKGINAVYEMAEIIERVERLNETLMQSGEPHGTVVLSDISCVSASLNAVPSECSIYLDRRMALGETQSDIEKEMATLVAGKRASWEVGTLRRTSWTGAEIVYEPLHEAWEIGREHPLAKACDAAYVDVFGHAPEAYDFWDFSTNAVTPVSMGIPCIGFGPGEYKLAHMRDENCSIENIKQAMRFYAKVIKAL